MATRHVLVVTTVPVDEGSSLRDEVRRHVGAESAEIHIVSPASKVSPVDWLTGAEDDARADAKERAGRTANAVDEVAPTEAEVGDVDPLMAIQDALATFPADEIIVVSQPGTEASWLEKDAAEEAFERFGLPVTHLVTERA